MIDRGRDEFQGADAELITVVTATPASSLTVLAVLLGVWSIIMRVFEIIGRLMLRRMASTKEATVAGPTGSAMTTGWPRERTRLR